MFVLTWPVRVSRCFFSIGLVLLGVSMAGYSQPVLCSDSDQGPRPIVRSVKIVARWAPEMILPLKKGDEFTPAKIRDTRLEFLKTIRKEKDKFGSSSFDLGRLSIVDITYVRVCGRKAPVKDCLAELQTNDCVDVEVRPFALTTDPKFLGSVLLPIPRSNRFTFLSNVPGAIRVLDPKFSLDRDGTLGTALGFQISTDLLSLDKAAAGSPSENKKTSLMLTAKARKSIGEVFYNAQTQLALVMKEPGKYIDSLGFETGFASNREPEKDLSHRFNAFRAGGHFLFRPRLGYLNQVYLGGGYRWSRNHLESTDTRNEISTRENSFDGRVILDGRLAGGFTRAGVWFDGGKPKETSANYKRLAFLIGYEKEIPVSGHTIGLEALAGTGWSSRKTPEYALFYGGNGGNDFLYLDAGDLNLSYLPAGPVVRGLGKNQAGIYAAGNRQIGGNSYRHFNLTISLPIPGLSRPLIPNEKISDNPPVTLRDVVDIAVNSGEEALSLQYEDEGLPEDQADKKAAKVFGEIRPGMDYLTRYAKVYAIKPMFMFDASSMAVPGLPSQVRYGVGGGVQLTVALAKFEFGYVQNTKRLTGDRQGNFVARFVFQNLF